MEIINPYFDVNTDPNIFTIREKEYQELEDTIREMLKPAEELDFEVVDFGFRNSKVSSGELQKTLKKNLIIKLQKGNNTIDLSMAIPRLIDRNYIVINGRKKIPLFQLFDIPIVTRGKTIKLRTNVATMMVFETKNRPHVHLSILGRKVPFHLLMFGYHGFEEMNNIYDFDNLETTDANMYQKVLSECKEYYEKRHSITQDDVIKEIGQFYSNYNSRQKGEDIIYALDLIMKVDIMSAKFFKTDSILEELLGTLNGEEYDDTDFQNKRIRCFEYVVLAKISKIIFDLCLSNRSARQAKFNVNSTQILSECNVSDIVQFDFAINPIDELTKLSRTSLVGPGGFKRENVPSHLRDICPTMFGRMCPVDTPDRDNCGVLQNLLVNSKFDENLKFTEETVDKAPISIPVSMVPFLEHDDQTRLQMASSQMRQSIMLKNFDVPMIQSGCEGLYTDKTQFIRRAKKNGEVVHQDKKYIIVSYEDKTIDVFNIEYRKIYVGNLDIFNIYVKTGDKFKAGDILAESNFLTDGKINIGKNLLTAVVDYYGYNFEDGIAISDRLVKEQGFTSVHYKDLSFTLPPDRVLLSLEEGENYKPLPNELEWIQPNEPYAIMKKLPTGITDYETIFEEPTEFVSRKPTMLTEINIYANSWNTDIPKFNEWVEEKIAKQVEQEKYFKKILTSHMEKDEATQFIKENYLDKFANTGKYKNKGEKVNGIHFEVYGIFFRDINVGDKIGNRHGNKGVISTIVPEKMMPQLEDGRHVDICINPLGIISRMNFGQVYELHLAMSLDDLKKTMLKMLEDKTTQAKLKKYLVDYIKIIDNTEGSWYTKQFIDALPKKFDEDFINQLFLIQPPFESIKQEEAKRALAYTNTKFEYPLYDPISKKKIVNPVAVGFMYFFRMVHIAETRLAARGIGSYAKRTLQPLGGRKNKGGQRSGEMETACLIAHDAPINLFEFITTKSDCIDLKNEYIRKEINSDLVKEEGERSIVPESVKLLNAYLTVIGVKR